VFAYGFVALSILLTLGSQVLQKQVADNSPREHLALTDRLVFYFRQGRFWLAMLLLFAAMLTWLVVLDLMDVGKAYPLLSLNYVLMLLVSRFLFAESVPISRWLGVLLIAAGILLISGGGR